jgi:hypothetical protein
LPLQGRAHVPLSAAVFQQRLSGHEVAPTAAMQPHLFSCLRTWPVKQDQGYSSRHSSSTAVQQQHMRCVFSGQPCSLSKVYNHQLGTWVSTWVSTQEVKHARFSPCSLGVKRKCAGLTQGEGANPESPKHINRGVIATLEKADTHCL